ncbi:MAG: SUMF1/EgtB/PvdO family nonheme iron enzyme [Anaerolinea sp.]|nr:SUMF1/EgtB/PvdO family nonheme iron enzyme [Anaerolinea sp.]
MSRIDVFISSTSKDLLDYREKVRAAVSKLGAHPIIMEEFSATERNALQKCYDEVQNAEVFVGIYAHRYGFAPGTDMTFTTKDGETRTGDGKTSITHWEYLWARERNLPLLLYVMADKDDDGRLVSVPPEFVDSEPGRSSLADFKKLIMGTHVIESFHSPDNLQARVTAALAPVINTLALEPVKPYLQWLHEQSKKSGLLQVLKPREIGGENRAVTVDQVYTALDTRTAVTRETETGRIVSAEEVARQKQAGKKDDDFRASALTAMEAASFYPHLVLLGDPGSGKSTFVNFLTLCLTGQALDRSADWLERLKTQGWTHGEKLPVVVTLRDFAQDVPADAHEGSAKLLFDHIERQLGKWKFEAAFVVIKQALETGNALVLLDGLDEVPPAKRELVRDTITRFRERIHRNNRLIVTCRILSYTDDAWQIPAMHVETIAPFDEDKTESFIRAWYTALGVLNEIDQETAEKRIADLTEGLQHPHLQNIAENPMLLTVMTIVHNHTGALPRESAKLYQQCVELLMLRWRSQEARALMENLDIREDDLYKMLWEIAYYAHDQQADREGAADISQADVLAIASRRLGSFANAEIFCEFVEKRAGLLIGRGYEGLHRVFTFPHRTFQEYLAGCYVASERFTRSIPKLARRGVGWHEVVMLASGHLVFNRGDYAQPLDAVNVMIPESLKPQNDEDWRVVALAGEMLELIGVQNVENDEAGREVLPRVRSLLAELVSQGQLPPIERAAAGRTLGILGDPRFGVGVNADGIPEIDWVEVPAGEFQFGNEEFACRRPEVIDLPAFRISRYQITNAQFLAFVNADDFDDDRWWTPIPAYLPRKDVDEVDEEDRDTRSLATWVGQLYANYPCYGVSWYQASAFCRWLSDKLGSPITLPTEEQWEKSARGTAGLLYPYGNEYDPLKSNGPETGINDVTAVGIFPNGMSPYQVHDLSGGVVDWCLNSGEAPYTILEMELKNNIAAYRGGMFRNAIKWVSTVKRLSAKCSEKGRYVGFRIVAPV